MIEELVHERHILLIELAGLKFLQAEAFVRDAQYNHGEHVVHTVAKRGTFPGKHFQGGEWWRRREGLG